MAPERAGRSSEGEGTRRPENGAQRRSQNLYRVVHIVATTTEHRRQVVSHSSSKGRTKYKLEASPGLKL